MRLIALVTHHPSHYEYLLESLRGFLTVKEFADLLSRCGFVEVRIVPMDLGIAHGVLARKPAQDQPATTIAEAK